METLKTATGKQFMCDYFNHCPPVHRCNIRILESSIVEVAAVFSNPAETVQLWCGDQYVAHYTRLVNIAPEDNAIRVVLGKE